MAVVKSNAYGHGLAEVVTILSEKADWFGVNSVEEALSIRLIDQKTPVLVMGAANAGEYSLLKNHQNVFVVVSTIESIREVSEILPSTCFHVKADTGMSRLGTHGDEFEKVIKFLSEHQELRWTGVLTHFANVEDVTDQDFANHQLAEFARAKALAENAKGNRNLLYHSAASGAAIILPQARMDIVRVGISLYGLWPSRETRISAQVQKTSGLLAKDFDLKPAMHWGTRIVHLNHVSAGQPIGYGCTFRPVTDSLVAVLPVGYYEGYDRRLGNRSHVLIRGLRCKVLGRVCMNMIMVDVTHVSGVSVNDVATLIGTDGKETVTAEDIAELSGTINYESVTRVAPHLKRTIVD